MSKLMRRFVVVSMLVGMSVAVAGQGGDPSRMYGYGYREGADFVIKRLGLRKNSVVADIGAGDGWWSSKIAEKLGAKGAVHAGEVDQKKVDAMKSKWADVTTIKPFLCPTDGTGQKTDSCDVVFISKTYHHFDKDGHIEYFKHLKDVVKPSGKVVILERHPATATGRSAEHGWLPGHLGHEAEQGGWMMLRFEMIPGSDHFMATFVQPEAFTAAFNKRKAAAAKKAEQAK